MDDDEFSILLKAIQALSDGQMQLLETVDDLARRIEWLEEAVKALSANQRLDQ
jgi:hypothetical protein